MKPIVLGGRKLRLLTSANIAHDYWLKKQLHDAGLRHIQVDPTRPAAESCAEILDRAETSGYAMVILGGLLAPAEMKAEDWTPAIAAEMTAHIERLAGAEDQLIVRGMVADAILGFFQAGLVSIRISRMSSKTRPSYESDAPEVPQLETAAN